MVAVFVDRLATWLGDGCTGSQDFVRGLPLAVRRPLASSFPSLFPAGSEEGLDVIRLSINCVLSTSCVPEQARARPGPKELGAWGKGGRGC